MEAPTAPSSERSTQLLAKLCATHANDDDPAVDLEPILKVVEKILDDVDSVINGTHGVTVTPALDNGKLKAKLADHIHRVSGELLCNCPQEGVHETTLKLLETLKTCSWNTKMVIVLAAFTANLGEFGLLLQRGNTNSLARCVDFLWQVPEIKLNALRDGVTRIVEAIRKLAKCNSKFMIKLNYWCFSKKDLPNLDAISDIIIWVTYWTIRSVAGIARLFVWRNKNTSITTEEGGKFIRQLENEVNQIYDILKVHFKSSKRYIDKQMENAYQRLLKLMEKPDEGCIVEILETFLFGEDIDKVDIRKLRSKHVLLLISDLDISPEEIEVLKELYQETEKYAIVWLPVLDGLCDEKKFLDLKKSMKWYTIKWYTNVSDILKLAIIEYIKGVWHFIKNPIAVLTLEGEVICPNALPLLWTWGNEAFPFTAEREKTLWSKSCDWRLDFLVDHLIDPELRKWIIEGSQICLYGGGNIDWIKQFTTSIKDVLKTIGETVEMVYVGKNNAKEWTGKVIAELQNHNLRVLKSEKHFWARLSSMLYLYTKMRQGKTLSKDNRIMLEIMKIFAYDGSAGGWAFFCKGADVIVRLEGQAALKNIFKYSDWENKAKNHGFLEGLNYYIKDQNIPHSCIQLKLPFIISEIPGKVQCYECGREMEMYYMYCCCKE